MRYIYFYILSLFLFQLKAKADFEITFKNKTNSMIDIYFNEPALTNSQSFFLGTNPVMEKLDFKSLKSFEEIIFSENVDFYLNLTKINISDTNIPCSWIYLFGLSKLAHGWGIEITVNNVKKTICANKNSVLDRNVNGKIDLFQSSKNQLNLHFYNTGWWESNLVFPTKIEF